MFNTTEGQKPNKLTKQSACEILGIDVTQPFTTFTLKQAYKQIATSLQTAQNNKEKLRTLNEAYLFLKEGLGNDVQPVVPQSPAKNEPSCPPMTLIASLPTPPVEDGFLRVPTKDGLLRLSKQIPTTTNNSNSDEDTEKNHEPVKRHIVIKQKADVFNATPIQPPAQPPTNLFDLDNIFPQQIEKTNSSTAVDTGMPLNTIHFIDLTLDEINNGLMKKITLNVKMPCPNCASVYGNTTMSNKILRSINRCTTCSGFNMVYESVEKTIVIPKMFDITTITKFEQEGNYNPTTGMRDNIIIKYRLAEKEPYLVKNEHDLFCTCSINIFDAWNGLSVYLHGYHFTYNGVVKDGETLYCENMGLPKGNENNAGRLLIKFKYIYPKKQPANENDYLKFLKQKENNEGKTSNHKTRRLHKMGNHDDDNIFGDESDELYEK